TTPATPTPVPSARPGATASPPAGPAPFAGVNRSPTSPTYMEMSRGRGAGRARSAAEPAEMDREYGEFRVYVVEVCQSCAWNRLAMSYVLGRGEQAPHGRQQRRIRRPRRSARASNCQDVSSPCTRSPRSPARTVLFGRRTSRSNAGEESPALGNNQLSPVDEVA